MAEAEVLVHRNGVTDQTPGAVERSLHREQCGQVAADHRAGRTIGLGGLASSSARAIAAGTGIDPQTRSRESATDVVLTSSTAFASARVEKGVLGGLHGVAFTTGCGIENRLQVPRPGKPNRIPEPLELLDRLTREPKALDGLG